MPRRTWAERRADPECRYADEFALALLMPRALVEQFVKQEEPIVVMAYFFGVPAECVVERLKMLGLWKPKRTNRFRDWLRRCVG